MTLKNDLIHTQNDYKETQNYNKETQNDYKDMQNYNKETKAKGPIV